MTRLILAAGLFVVTASASLYAQSMDMQANVPFDFRIGNAVLPSGEYSIHHVNNILFVSQKNGAHKSAMVFTVGTDRPKTASAKGTLRFNRYGDSYYLSQVWTPDTETARAPLKSPRERELASHIGLASTASVALLVK